METIELWAQKSDGVWVMLDYDGDLAYNYQTNDFQNPDVRKANYSQAIKLEKTKTNLEVFGYIDIAEIKSTRQYRKIPVRGYWSGITLIDESGYAVVNSIDKTINIQILSGAASFFDLIKSLPFKNLDLGEFKREHTLTQPAIRERFFIPFISPFNMSNTYIDMYEPYATSGLYGVPFVKMTETLQYIFSQIGYSLELKKANSNEYVLSVNSMVEIERDFSVYDCNIWMKVNGLEFISEEGSLGNYYHCQKTHYPQMKGILRGQISANNPQPFNYPNAKLKIYKGAVADENLIAEFLGVNYNNYFEVEVEGNLNSQIIFDFYSRSSIEDQPTIPPDNDDLQWDISLQFSTDVVGKFVQENNFVNISGNMGFETYWDFIKLYVQVYGLNFFVDEKNKKVLLFNISMLTTDEAIDLSNYQIVEDNPISEFHATGMAQRNFLSFEHNEIDNNDEEDVINIDDTTLEYSKDFINYPIEAGGVRLVGRGNTHYVLSMPVFIMDIPVGLPPVITEENYNDKMKRHIGQIVNSINVKWGDVIFQTYEVLNSTLYHNVGNSYRLDFDAIFKNYVKIKRKFIVDEEIFTKLIGEPKLIYLQETGSYYILDKIQNYTPGKPITLELIKVNI